MHVDSQRESLALGVACGRSVRLWAKHHDVEVQTAWEWFKEREFRALVAIARLRVADRMVGRLLMGARQAVHQLVRLCTKSPSEAIRLSASRALLHHWVQISDHDDVAKRIRAVEAHDQREDQMKRQSGYSHPK